MRVVYVFEIPTFGRQARYEFNIVAAKSTGTSEYQFEK